MNGDIVVGGREFIVGRTAATAFTMTTSMATTMLFGLLQLLLHAYFDHFLVVGRSFVARRLVWSPLFVLTVYDYKTKIV